MALRYRRLREISRLLPQIHSGDCYIQCRSATKLAALSIIPRVYSWERNGTRMPQSRFSTTSEVSYNSTQELDLLSFIKSSLDEREGPCHCWLNRSKGNRDFLGRDGTFLVLAGRCETFLTTCESVMMLEKVKSLQQRYPQLHVMGFLSGSSVSLAADRSHLIQYVMKEYVTFPVILSNRTFPEMDNGACYILFKDFESPVFYHEKDLDLRILDKAVEEFHVQDDGRARSRDNLKSTWVKQFEIIKEPYVYALRNLLLNFPGCVSADESGNRLFLSDSSHHRIIVFDGNGKILDCIGSSPGFEDGNFESAKMVRPASSLYDAAEDSLYFVDSENHAIRKADLGKRVLETVYPNYDASKKSNSIWTRIMIKLGLRSNDKRPEEFDIQALMFPWHLMKSSEDSFFIINRSFETLWILNLASGEIEQVVKGFPKILDVCGPQIMEKVSLLKQMPHDWLQQQTNAVCSPKRLPYASLISSLTTLQNHVILCDMVGQQILKLSEEAGVCSAFQFSNFGILGLPYWLASSLERVYTVVGGHQEEIDHQECFSLLPGRIGIQLNVEIPVGTELVEQLQEGCIWRQARGAATEVLGAEDAGGSSEKVGAAQQWYDELDNLAFSLSTPESELNVEDDRTTSDIGFQDARVHIDCAVNTSPGTSEVIVYAALYLKLRKQELLEADQEKCAARIADILNSERSGKMGRDSFIQFLLNSNRDLRDLIFMKPLHVRVKLDCLDHPKAANGKDIILTDSNIEKASAKRSNSGKREQLLTPSEREPTNNVAPAEVPKQAPAAEQTTNNKNANANANKDGGHNIAAQTFTFRELATATKNFRQECLIGEGGFGRVYKGKLETTEQIVAVKQLDRNGLQGNREFLVEVLMLSLLHHDNLVNLIGYCADGDQRLLVYEYMPLGSLEDHLLDLPSEQKPLDWFKRMKIALGAAKGLEYLHDKANPPVIYRDLKSSNILLDGDFNAKLSDFGLAKLGPVGDKTHVSSRIMGTYGYCAPEYQRTGQLTVKSDVYSFGVVLLELITGRRAIDTTRPTREQNLVTWAEPVFKDPHKFPELADPLLQGDYPVRALNQAVAVAAMCLHDEAPARPLMSDVVSALSFLGTEDDESVPGSPLQSDDEEMSNVEDENPKDEETVRERERAVAEAIEWGSTSRSNAATSKLESTASL